MRRILLLITDLEIGGTPTVVRELGVRLNDPPRVRVEVACLSKWGPVASQLRDRGIAVTALGARGAADVRVFWRLVQLIRRRRFDTVFSFLVHANTAAAVASLFCRGVRFIQSVQTTQPRPRWHWRVQAVVQHAAEKVVVPSASAARVARQWADVPAGKIVVIPNAIDPAAFPRSPIPSAAPRPYPIGFIGRLDPIKRVPELIGLMASMPGQGALHLHVFGDGPERSAVQDLVERLRLRSVVSLHGAVDGAAGALRQIGLLVLPSIAEGFGLVLIEAMAAGVPVVATDVDGIRDVVRDGETGLLVRSVSSELAGAILRVTSDAILRERLIDNGLREVRSRYTWERVLEQYRELLF